MREGNYSGCPRGLIYKYFTYTHDLRNNTLSCHLFLYFKNYFFLLLRLSSVKVVVNGTRYIFLLVFFFLFSTILNLHFFSYSLINIIKGINRLFVNIESKIHDNNNNNVNSWQDFTGEPRPIELIAAMLQYRGPCN